MAPAIRSRRITTVRVTEIVSVIVHRSFAIVAASRMTLVDDSPAVYRTRAHRSHRFSPAARRRPIVRRSPRRVSASIPSVYGGLRVTDDESSIVRRPPPAPPVVVAARSTP
jgi:hypothetical protein